MSKLFITAMLFLLSQNIFADFQYNCETKDKTATLDFIKTSSFGDTMVGLSYRDKAGVNFGLTGSDWVRIRNDGEHIRVTSTVMPEEWEENIVSLLVVFPVLHVPVTGVVARFKLKDGKGATVVATDFICRFHWGERDEDDGNDEDDDD